ncbi:Cro/Cl family transcriptional regulator [Paraburkholderia silviterrae]|uniref:Cro/Cl family transcriptional regulator n=2 Tax=Paraburkholderia silviterrae TaxID=2528715 RepID=A0A4R5MFX5_9BURK|nr:Cro/Cl family transcriptional regulator [Paraburkholderia silviterrae]
MSPAHRKEFAKRCGTTYAFLRNVMYGQRIAGEKLCVRIERESGLVVTRRDLRPDDWYEIWPELADQQSVASSDDVQPPTGGAPNGEATK